MKKTVNCVVKESITEALLRLMQKKNFYTISITELTNLAGVSRISFYRNFESKEDVLIKHMYERSVATFTDLNATNVRERLIGLFKVTDELGDILDLLYSQNLSHLFLQYFAHTIGAKPEQTNLEAFQNSMMMGICFGALDEWVKRGRNESPEQMVELLQDVVKRCLAD
ncbi:TetR/AcrR family transcriptional regulator [Actinobacillus suis]|uniref:TetR family transcriptional regulator n=2 Tax=Actinobacillus suis TaxID=716 RepID=K0G833_ACTSU|nr:TetR/AcrR family transcriptional regulator [Actinobacillus suis]AFU19884.1 TetR family transcriptional regulator [Actinobacillus suis H91-0380]AIJ32022.1 TetR family transcriptional regulator [Actinobacillus suis ATCC 33415]MCO4166062.1 TetR/AcrR family transcriptional regulator [Actinobacillus suis]MCO4169454.1 TetR/AcrR family transcriptional regulator [Actinobacillus suis]MCQ9630203.1 TetR/AcrR family transcriptional regulator [Actinobacillus suis]